MSPQRLKNCDFDEVEVSNLARTNYSLADALVRRKKVFALARRLEDISPLVKVHSYPKSITAMTEDELDDLFDGVDLVIAGTDHFQAQALINQEAVKRRVPAVFIGIHAGAQGGRVIWTLPGVTPCYRCVARERYQAARDHVDAADLKAAVGGIFDCQFIDMIAGKLVLAILERGQDSVMGHFFQRMGVRNDVIVRCDPGYGWGNEIWNAVLADLPRGPKDFARELKENVLFAMDTIWLQGEYDPECPVCGAPADRKV